MLIALNGLAGSGKDTLANILVEQGFTRYAFADAVRELALKNNPILTTHWVYDSTSIVDLKISELRLSDVITAYGWDRAKREVPEVRRILQTLGVGVREVVGSNAWVDVVSSKWGADGVPDAVVPDLRFENEEGWVRNEGGKVLRIVRPNNPHNIGTSHVSEQYTPSHDFLIVNDGTLDDLKEKVLQVLEDMCR